jgi:hypothetical protein
MSCWWEVLIQISCDLGMEETKIGWKILRMENGKCE